MCARCAGRKSADSAGICWRCVLASCLSGLPVVEGCSHREVHANIVCYDKATCCSAVGYYGIRGARYKYDRQLNSSGPVDNGQVRDTPADRAINILQQ